jgi:aspartyl aminopeptidase
LFARLWNTWFDRDLSLAGRVIVREAGSNDKFKSVLIKVDKPILRIPNLAIHLNRGVNDEGFKFNLESNLVPVLASTIIAELADKQQGGASKAAAAGATETKSSAAADSCDHHQQLLALVAKSANVQLEDIADFELCLYDTQPPQLGGLYDEFVYSRALDNLCMSYVCTAAFLGSNANSKTQCSILALFDNEEIGSNSTMGAGSNLLHRVLLRINGADTLDSAINKSILVSADMAHGVHPNYADKHEGAHRPMLQNGLVIKENCNQRYATSVVTAHFVKVLAAKHKIPIQKFVVRNDVGCGSTIGPILASSCGIRTFDCGIAQWAMHSIRECCGVNDIASSIDLLSRFYSDFADLDANLTIDKK